MPINFRHTKRLLSALGLGISTTFLVLGLNLNPLPLAAQMGRVDLTGTKPTIAQTTTSAPSPFDLVQQGKTAYQKGEINQAIARWTQAAKTFESKGDRLHQAMTLSYLAQAYQQLGDWSKANPAIAKSFKLLTEGNPGMESDRLPILAEAQTIQGSLQLDQGEASAALSNWEQAEKTFQQAGNQTGVIRSQINQSQALLTLGFYKRSNKLLASLYEKRPTSEPLQLSILLNYGESLRLVGNLPQEQSNPPQNALTILQQGLDLAQKIKSPNDITTAQISLGNLYRDIYQQKQRLQTKPCTDPKVLANLTQSMQYYQQAVQGTDSPISKVQSLSNQQSILLINKSNPQYKQQILTIAEKIKVELDRVPVNRTSLYARIQLANNLIDINSSQAISLLEESLKQAQNLGDTSAQSYSTGYLAKIYENQSSQENSQELNNRALKLTNEALKLAREINAPEIYYRWFWQLGRLERSKNHDQAIKNYAAAYLTLRTLRQDLDTENLNLQFSFRKQPVEIVYREFVDLLLRPQTISSQPLQNKTSQYGPQPERNFLENIVENSIRDPIRTARYVIQDLQTTELENFLQEPCASKNIEAIDKGVDKPSSFTATLYPIVLPDRIEVIAKFPGKPLSHYSYNISKEDVRKKVDRFQTDLQEAYTFDDVKKEGYEIYQWFISQAIQEQLEKDKIKTIVFSLDGVLRNISIAALHDGEGYLIEKYAVATAIDLEVPKPEPLPNDQLKVLAASLSQPPQQHDGKFKFAKLTYVDEELNAIKDATRVKSTQIRDSQFTRDSFNRAFNNAPFEIVHIATHGQFSSNPEDTFILTAESKRFPDGKIRLNDFDEMFRTRELNRPDSVELLILSACETAAGDDRATLGIAGAAVKAGARSAIASLWSLDDKSSQLFMSTFYEAITQPNTSRAQALRSAQLALLRNSDYSHPRYWAAFLLVGNWL